jgi:hypothetical protein
MPEIIIQINLLKSPTMPRQKNISQAKPSQARYLFNITSKHPTSQARTHLQAQASSAKPSHKPSSKLSQKPSSMPSQKSSRDNSSNKVYAYIQFSFPQSR